MSELNDYELLTQYANSKGTPSRQKSNVSCANIWARPIQMLIVERAKN
jgi:hypothetical protein